MEKVIGPAAATHGFLYGTAWKEERTRELTALALDAGFRGIDTANQRKHYVEAHVGEALADALRGGRLARGDVFLQTKFTYERGQDHRLPYDPAVDLGTQVRQSMASSLDHLQTDYVDSYVLHSPAAAAGWTATDDAAWSAMRSLRDEGMTRFLGVSNVSRAHVEQLCAGAHGPPDFVQNRCRASGGWDREVRAACRANGVVYQAFSLLTANREVVGGATVAAIAERHGATPAQVVFRFAQQLGMVPLTGTSSPAHMSEDLGAAAIELSRAELDAIESAAG